VFREGCELEGVDLGIMSVLRITLAARGLELHTFPKGGNI